MKTNQFPNKSCCQEIRTGTSPSSLKAAEHPDTVACTSECFKTDPGILSANKKPKKCNFKILHETQQQQKTVGGKLGYKKNLQSRYSYLRDD